MVDELDGVPRPTLYGLMVFGRAPQGFRARAEPVRAVHGGRGKDQARKGGAPRSRNEMMANAMVVGGLMERRGRGWLTMRHAMRRFNGTEPELVSDERDRFVRVTFERGTRGA